MNESELLTIAFPRFEAARMTSLDSCPRMQRQRFRNGERLFEAGEPLGNFFIVKSGEVVILDESDETPKVITVHGPGQFSGEVAQLTGSPALVSAEARGDVEVYVVSPDALQEILSDYPELGDVILQAFLARRQLLRESGRFTGLRVIGSRFSQDTFRVREFLAKNRLPFTWLDLENDPQAKQLLTMFGISEAETPVVAYGHKMLLRNPSNGALSEALGLRRPLQQTVYDLVIVGAGPAGLAAAVYAASEGLRTVAIERIAPGGQAGRSMRIENYLGFPTGITGGELAERAVAQATKFGARIPVGTHVTRLAFDHNYSVLTLDDGETVVAKCLLVATGADYRLLGIEGCAQFEGRGVYYAATRVEAQQYGEEEVVVVGGGNSAGQAAVFLARQARKVHLLVRSTDPFQKMSSYLARRIEQTDNIEVCPGAEVRRMDGNDALASIEVADKQTGRTHTLETPALFSFIGAVPRTEWLPPEIETDDKRFVRTGPELERSPYWTARRQPFLLETSRPGVFAAGDVRCGSVKRVASAVGEGSMVVQFVHEYLRDM